MPSNRKLKKRLKPTVFFEIDEQKCQHCNLNLNRNRLFNILCLKCKKLHTPEVRKLKLQEDKYNVLARMRVKAW